MSPKKAPPCDKTRRFDTLDDALVAMHRAMRRTGAAGMRAYPCPTCRKTNGHPWWHYGHTATRARRATGLRRRR